MNRIDYLCLLINLKVEITQIGKISWWWNTLNVSVYKDLEKIDDSHKRIIKIDEFDYEAYVDLHKFAGGKNLLTETKFENIRQSTHRVAPPIRTVR